MNTQDTQPGCPKPESNVLESPQVVICQFTEKEAHVVGSALATAILQTPSYAAVKVGRLRDALQTLNTSPVLDANLIAKSPTTVELAASNTALREALAKLIHYADGEMTHMEAEIALENAIAAARAALSQSEDTK